MRAILYYRRLPFDWVQITPDIRLKIKHDGPPVIPILRLPEDQSLHVDSTPLAFMLEERHSERSIIPDDPALADFGLFGQLKTLASDHTSMLIMRNTVPSVYDWVRRLADSSGIEGEWHDFAGKRAAVSELLRLSARYYLPFLQANANAHAEGADTVTVDLAGRTFEQPMFKYQVKCYARLRKLFQNEQTDALRDLLAETGCLQYLES